MEKRLFTYVVLGVLVWAVLGTFVASYYSIQYDTYQNEYNNLVDHLDTYNDLVNVLVDQLAIYNDVVVELGVNLSTYNDLARQLGANIENISNILEGISLETNILMSYGNQTKVFHNNTVLPLGSTAFTAIYFIADDINYTDYGGELGVLVTSINGVDNNSTHGWFYWYWDSERLSWILPEYSCAKHTLHKGDTIAFSYASYMEWPPSPPT